MNDGKQVMTKELEALKVNTSPIEQQNDKGVVSRELSKGKAENKDNETAKVIIEVEEVNG